jgi:hypothetical protein
MPILLTANVKSNPTMRQWKVVHDVQHAASLADVVLWQEIIPKRYKRAVRDLDRTVWQTEHLDTEVPISFRKDIWSLVKGNIVPLHHGRALTSPNRDLTWVKLRHNISHDEIVFVNTHYVSGAWNHKRRLHKAWRQMMWKRSWNIQHIFTLSMDDEPIIGGGDFNRLTLEPFVATQDEVWAPSTSIDHIYTIPTRALKIVVIERRKNSNNFTDHDFRYIRYNMHAR